MQISKGNCKSTISKNPRHRITIALNGELWDRFQGALEEHWKGGSFTSWVEYAMECYSRDSCKGCPYEPEEPQEKAPDGIGKLIDEGN